MERLKQELSRVQKLDSDHASQIDRLNKQNDSLEAKLQETRKQHLVDQAEIKEIRVKLRMSENERGHLALRAEGSDDAKKSLAALERKWKDELQERDERILELERAVATGQRKNERLEGKLLESKETTRREIDEARKTISSLHNKVADAAKDVDLVRTGAGYREEELIAQLESARIIIQQVAQEYGRLASSTVPKADYDVLRQENYTLRLHVNRLERKFDIADFEAAEAIELLNVSQSQNRALETILKGVWEELDSINVASKDLLVADDSLSDDHAEIETHLASIALNESTRRNEATSAHLSSIELFACWYKALGRTLLYNYSLACTELAAAAKENQVHQDTINVTTTHASTLSTQLEAAKLQTDSIQRQAADLSLKLEAADAREASLKEGIAKREKEIKAEKQVAKERLERERETVKSIQTSMERQRFAEDEMRHEITVCVI